MKMAPTRCLARQAGVIGRHFLPAARPLSTSAVLRAPTTASSTSETSSSGSPKKLKPLTQEQRDFLSSAVSTLLAYTILRNPANHQLISFESTKLANSPQHSSTPPKHPSSSANTLTSALSWLTCTTKKPSTFQHSTASSTSTASAPRPSTRYGPSWPAVLVGQPQSWVVRRPWPAPRPSRPR